MTFAIKQNDTLPTLSATLKDADDAVVSLAGATMWFHMRRVGSGTASVDSAAVVIGDGSAGKVRYNWSASDTASLGTHEGESEVTFADSTVETFPNNGFFSITVTDDLA